METGSVSSSQMQLGVRRGSALTAQKARANARTDLGSEIVKFAVMDDVAIAVVSIAKSSAVVGGKFLAFRAPPAKYPGRLRARGG